MEKTLKFIKDSFPDIEVFESLKINEYFTASYVIAQNGIIKAVFVPYKPKPESLNGRDKDLYYHSSGITDGITYYFDNNKVYKNIPGIKVIEIEEISSNEDILKPFSKDIFVKEFEFFEQDIESCLIEISRFQKIAIEKFNGNKCLYSQIHLLQTDYTSKYKRYSFLQNIKYKNSDNKINEIWISFDSKLHRIKLKEECDKEYINSFELNFTSKTPYFDKQRLMDDCKRYIEIFEKSEYLVSLFY
jgi:hypothetical protein